MPHSAHQQKVQILSDQFLRDHQPVQLEKSTSNLFRTRAQSAARKLDVRDLNQVLGVDSDHQLVEVEGMTTYEDLTDACLQRQCMPFVVPQLKSITIGGAVAGIGVESTSFRLGLPHESVTSMDVLLGSGEVVTCTPDNEHSDLYYGFPNSYGTLGYIMKLTAKTMPVKPYVALNHVRYSDIDEYFRAVDEACHSDVDFVDGSIFGGNEMYLTLGRFTDKAPYTSDYSWLKIYYRSIRERDEDYLKVRDYIWRWDTDWFWCSQHLFVQNLPMRLLVGRRHLNSITYQKIMRWNNRVGFKARLNKMLGHQPESVVQDVDIPIERAPDFLRFFLEEIAIRPVWMCPVGVDDTSLKFPLFSYGKPGLYVNFGFWDVVDNPEQQPPGYFNRKVENKVLELGGIKSLYSDVFYDESTFRTLYNGEHYAMLKQKYDPEGRLKNMYEKCVLKA